MIPTLLHESIWVQAERAPDQVALGMGPNALSYAQLAECVENDTVLERVREIGVDYAQGYGIGRPRPIAEMT